MMKLYWRSGVLPLFFLTFYVVFKIITRSAKQSPSNDRGNYEEKSTMLEEKLLRDFKVTSLSSLKEYAEILLQKNDYVNIVKDQTNYDGNPFRPPRYITNSHFIFNCSTIPQISIIRQLGHGVTKKGFLGHYKGTNVVVKIFDLDLIDIKECTEAVNGSALQVMKPRCEQFTEMKILREILILQEILHPNLAKLLGYCVKGRVVNTSKVTEHGVVSIIEYGRVNAISDLTSLPWRKKLKHSLDLASLLKYMETSPLGSIFIHRSIVQHFIWVNSTLKMFDLDRTDNADKVCTADRDCEYDISCDKKTGQCLGYNAVRSLDKMQKVLIFLLTPLDYPQELQMNIEIIRKKLSSQNITSDDLVKRLNVIRHEAIELQLA